MLLNGDNMGIINEVDRILSGIGNVPGKMKGRSYSPGKGYSASIMPSMESAIYLNPEYHGEAARAAKDKFIGMLETTQDITYKEVPRDEISNYSEEAKIVNADALRDGNTVLVTQEYSDIEKLERSAHEAIPHTDEAIAQRYGKELLTEMRDAETDPLVRKAFETALDVNAERTEQLTEWGYINRN
jgi:hypothetical protein